MLWAAAMEGLNATNDDVLDLIEEICRLREIANLAPLDHIPTPANPAAIPLQAHEILFPCPWDEEFPGNP